MASSQADLEPPPLPRPPTPPSTRDRLRDFRDRLADLIDDRGRWRSVAIAGVLALAGLGAWVLTRPPDAGPPLESVLPTVEPLVATTPAIVDSSPLVVHVAGAVARPGLVEVPTGSRVADAVVAAGGATATADLDRINLALPLSDADHVHVPAEGEIAVGQGALGGPDPGPLDLNRADEAALDELPGVGPATAAAIVAHRDEHGPFTSVTALQEVPGIGPAKLERLRELVRVGA
ncbi:MAG: ComEA family DNA-binding protein [Actinomycetota bacterium]